MREGVWHQFGDKSQRQVIEQLEQGVGVGVVLSPRDMAPHKAFEYAPGYRALGAEVLFDPQFYVPDASAGMLGTWPIDRFRGSVSALNQITTANLEALASELQTINGEMGATAVIAPSVVQEYKKSEIRDLNRRLFSAAKMAGDSLGVPTCGTIAVGRSGATSDSAFFEVLSAASAVRADGWYYAFEFGAARIPSHEEEVLRLARGCLTLAASGVPVLHAFAGPMAIVSVAAGATGVGIGHAQNLWRFTPGRFVDSPVKGGGGDAPPRLFSRNLWGTIVYPDEVPSLPADLRSLLVESSPFAPQVSHTPPYVAPSRWDAGKHLVFVLGKALAELYKEPLLEKRAEIARSLLADAVGLIGDLSSAGIQLQDSTDQYQWPWLNALNRLRELHEDDYEYVSLLD